MDHEGVFVAILLVLMLESVAGESYSPEEVYYCPAAQPCTAQQGLPPSMPHGPEWDSSNSGPSFTTSAVMATGPTGPGSVGAGASFGGSGGFFVGDQGIRVIKGSLGPTGPKQPFTTGAPSGYVPTGPAGP
jgi:hypothetical protein